MALRVPLGAPGFGDDDESVEAPSVAFEELWAERDVLRSYCLRLVGDPALADDMVQEAFIEAYRQLERLEHRGSFLPWLATVAKRRGLNELRRRQYSTPVAEFPEPPVRAEADPAEVVAHRDDVARVRRAMLALTPRERRLLTLQLVGGQSAEQMALAEGTTPGSVRSVIMRARSKLRHSLEGFERLVLVPVAGAVDGVRRRTSNVAARLQEAVPGASAAGGLGEFVTAAVITVTVGATVAPIQSPPAVDVVLGATSAAAPDAATPFVAPSRDLSLDVRRGPADVAVVGTTSTQGTTIERQAPPGGDDATPVDPPSPLPTMPVAPVDPAEPIPHDEPDDPSDAHFHDFGSPSDGGEEEASSTDGSGGGSDEVFALGTNAGRCAVECTVLFHTSDGGATWERLPASGIGDADQILVAPGYPVDNRIYAMGPDGLRRSTDGGHSFTPVLAAPITGPAVMSPRFSDGDERVFIGTQPGWIYDAAADVLTPFTGAPLAGTYNYAAFAQDADGSEVMFVSTVVNGPARTSRALIYRCSGGVCDEVAGIDGLTEAPGLLVASLPSRSSVVAWGGGRLSHSIDGGRSFEEAAAPTVSGKISDVGSDTSGRLFAAVHDSVGLVGGVLVSSDLGKTWRTTGQATPLGSGAVAVSGLGSGQVIASAAPWAATGLFASDDGGDRWERQ